MLLCAIAIPIVGALIVVITRNRWVHLPILVTGVTLGAAIFLLAPAFTGKITSAGIQLSGPFQPTFQADPLAAAFAILASFLWFAVAIYTPKYLQHEERTLGFQVCTLLTLAAVLGIFLAGDLFTMLLFFELMTIFSYFWVIHKWNKEAIRAGYFYLFFSITGGLFLALGIALLGDPAMFSWGVAFAIIGFGIKAGMAPLHLWLPHAHSVAPTPGSALLSGLIIKVGAFGIIRIGQLASWGMGPGTINFGPSLAIAGGATMAIGVIAALLQSDAKRLLAYHSVSQMGYILLGLGLVLSSHGTNIMGLTGAIYHIINHALFKSALFLGIGILILRTGQQNLYKMGGLWRKFPLTALLVLVAILGITGTPGLNGYASKTLLHHAVSAAADQGGAFSVMAWLERLFTLVGVGTTASFAKLFYLAFLGKPKAEVKNISQDNRMFHGAMVILSAAMITIGLFPHLFIDLVANPILTSLGFNEAALGQLAHINFWAWADLRGMVFTLSAGILFCGFGLKTGLFHLSPPAWLSIESIAQAGLTSFTRASTAFGRALSNLGGWLKHKMRQVYTSLLSISLDLDYNITEKTSSVNFSNLNFSALLVITILFLVFIFYLL